MTKEDIEKVLQSGNLRNSKLRELDFLIRRVGSEADALQSTHERGLDDTDATGEPLSMAEQRLQQLYLFRQRKNEQTAELAENTEGGVTARDMVVTNKINWLPIGPAGVERGQAANEPVVSGRTKGIVVAAGGNRVYIATANGGAWYSGNEGKTWQPLLDQESYFPDATIGTPSDTDSLACGAIALVAGTGRNTDRIYLGTGEGNGMTDAYLGVGALMSNNGGMTWTREGGGDSLIGKGFYAMVVDPDDSEHVIGATSDGIYARVPKTGGESGYKWVRKALSGQRVSGLVVANGLAGKKFFASVWGDKVYASDNGHDWSPLGTDFPMGRIGRMSIGAHPQNTNVVYVMIALEGAGAAGAPEEGNLKGVYRFDATIDDKWYEVTGNTPTDSTILNSVFGDTPTDAGQGNYDNCLIVAPNNVNRIYLGGSTTKSDILGAITTVNGHWSGSLLRCDVTVARAGTAVSLTTAPVFIGGSMHGDLHSLSFTPNEPEKLWVGCDGGVFKTNHATAMGGMIFESKNLGLQTLTINHMDVHPNFENVLFCGVQDNGGVRFTGEPVWLHSSYGDGGYYVINWKTPYQVISTYNKSHLRYNSVGGNRAPTPDFYTVETRHIIPLVNTAAIKEYVDFYAPLVGVPFKTGLSPLEETTQSNILAFGTQRLWISTQFGVAGSWNPIPSRDKDPTKTAVFIADSNVLGNAYTNGLYIQALAFVDSKTILVGMSDGQMFRFKDLSGAANDWSVVSPPDALNTATGGADLPAKAISAFAINPSNLNQFYVTFSGTIGGGNGHRHVWLYDETPASGNKWKPKSGTGVQATSLIDMHFNAVIVNPIKQEQVFAGSDVGVWLSNDGGDTWETFSHGLPETAVIDMKISVRDIAGEKKVFLRASTYGRGIFECDISNNAGNTKDVQLYLRGTFLDRGYYPTALPILDPTNGGSGSRITEITTPDIKIDTPNTEGRYQFGNRETLSWGQHHTYNEGTKAQNIPVPASGMATTRVYVQVNSRGIFPANNVQVMLLIKEVTAGPLPALAPLPANFQNDFKAGIPIERDGWKTVGIQTVSGVRAGAAQVVRFDLHSLKLPRYADVGAGKDFFLVALLHHPQDEFFKNKLNEDLSAATIQLDPSVVAGNLLLSDERKIVYKKIRVVQHAAFPAAGGSSSPLLGYVSIPATATAPEAPFDAFLGMAFRLNDAWFNTTLAARLAQPISNRGTQDVVGVTRAGSFYMAETIETTTDISLEQGTSLIWFARKKIVIGHTINGIGKGATSKIGDFGGSGGGGASLGGSDCVMPLSNPPIVLATGGVMGTAIGMDADPVWASRIALFLSSAKGGAGGGNDGVNLGGLGGGCVVLCAPTIEFVGTGKIDVSGDAGAVNAGGGGGGIIMLIAAELINVNTEGVAINLKAEGGVSGGSGGKGGKGVFILKNLPQV